VTRSHGPAQPCCRKSGVSEPGGHLERPRGLRRAGYVMEVERRCEYTGPIGCISAPSRHRCGRRNGSA